MPRGDKTGPNGLGPMTGRAAGFCAGNNMPGYAGSGFGRGLGRGRGAGGGYGMGGFGRGFRNMFLATGLPGWARTDTAGSPTADEKQVLTNQAKVLQAQVEDIQKRLKELDGE